MKKQKGLLFKTWKPFELYLLENGFLLFYTANQSSNKFGEESVAHRLELDERLRIENVRDIVNKVNH